MSEPELVSKLEAAVAEARSTLESHRQTETSEEAESMLRYALERILDALYGHPGATGLRIDEMWAWVIMDPLDGNEGIPAVNGKGGVMMPLVGADLDMAGSFREHATEIAKTVGRPIELRRFREMRVLEVIEP